MAGINVGPDHRRLDLKIPKPNPMQQEKEELKQTIDSMRDEINQRIKKFESRLESIENEKDDLLDMLSTLEIVTKGFDDLYAPKEEFHPERTAGPV